MSEKTNISWCDSTANPVIGCAKVSPGCLNCYAAIDTPARVLRKRGLETWGANAERYAVKGFEKQMLAFNRKLWVCECGSSQAISTVWCKNCLGEKPHRRRVFVGSNCDILDPAWSADTLARTLDVIRRCPDMEIILCTKRPELFPKLMEEAWLSVTGELACWITSWTRLHRPPPNLTLLTSVENQAMADKRIPELLKIPAARRGLSIEPLLGPVDLMQVTTADGDGPSSELLWIGQGAGIDWVIVGGESGQHARPCNVEWIRSIVQQCGAARVPCFVKQMGSNIIDPQCHSPYPIPDAQCWPVERGVRGDEGECRIYTKYPKGADLAEWPHDLRVQQFPT